MLTQIFCLGPQGIVIGSTGLSGLRQAEDSVSVPLRSRIHYIGDTHSVAVLSLDDEYINNVPVEQLLKTWSASLDERLEKVEDYVASFIEFLETADIRMFPSQGEASWTGSSMSWLLEKVSYELVSEFFNSDEELLSLHTEYGTPRSLKDLSRMHDLFLRLLDEKIEERFKLGIPYTSFTLRQAIAFFQSNLDEAGFEKSWVSTLAQAFQVQLTTNFGFEGTEDFALSEKFVESLLHYSALLICTRLAESEQGAVLSFVGYGEKQTYPVLTSVVIDGVFLKVQYYSVELDNHAYWAGEGYGPTDIAEHDEIEVGAEKYPLWCHSPDSNRPIKMLSIGGTGLCKAWMSGMSDSVVESLFNSLQTENNAYLSEKDKSLVDTEERNSARLLQGQFSSWVDELRLSSERVFNERARSLILKGQAHVVESLLRLESYNGLTNNSQNSVLDMGTPIQLVAIVPGQSPSWLKDEL